MFTWLHIGDLHAEDADDWASVAALRDIAEEARTLGDAVDLIFLPGDIANHGEAGQYRRVAEALAPAPQPIVAIPGDHDFEPGDLRAFDGGLANYARPPRRRLDMGGCRVLALDVVSAGTGGPDFRLDGDQRRWLEAELIDARRAHLRPVVFMHAFPGDLIDGDDLARLLALNEVAFVDTGHTHYNELLNDGRVVYAATRSTGQIDEGDVGYALQAVDGAAVSWRFKPLGAPFPFAMITSPTDRRLVTRPAAQTPDGDFTVRARVFGARDDATVTLTVDADRPRPMRPAADEPGVWCAEVPALRPGRHALRVTAAQDGSADADQVEIDCGWREDAPVRGRPGDHSASIGAWPAHGLMGTRLGPNANGTKW